MTIDMTTRYIERTSRGWKAISSPLADDTNPIAKAQLPAQTPTRDGEELPCTMDILMQDFEEHFMRECPWNDSGTVPSLVELVNHFCDCRQESFDKAQIFAHALLAQLTGSAYA